MPDVKIFAKTVEQAALDQINLLASQPAFAGAKIRIMPDVHAGAGCVIGFTSDLGDKVIPDVVGVDIGCGMLCVQLQDPVGHDRLDKLDTIVRAKVPCGFSVHPRPIAPLDELNGPFCVSQLRNIAHLECSLGTLGGGNHFIELDTDASGRSYLVIHTGSRNLGKQVADIYQHLAAEQHPDMPKDLAYLAGEDRAKYLHDMEICQRFAKRSRQAIAHIILNYMGWHAASVVETIHNYIDHDSNIVRKGAVSAKAGERLIIPMNMAFGSLLCAGKGNEDWNCSAPHGAGRLMGRNQAKRTLSMEDYQRQMDGVFSTSVCPETLDEAPMAYKPMKEIVSCIADTVEVERVILPIYNFKATEQ